MENISSEDREGFYNTIKVYTTAMTLFILRCHKYIIYWLFDDLFYL